MKEWKFRNNNNNWNHTLYRECRCCRNSFLGYWPQSWTGRHSDAGYSNDSIIPASWYSICQPRKDDRLSQAPGVLIQQPTGLELRTLGSQTATLTTTLTAKPTPGLNFDMVNHNCSVPQ